MKKSKESQTKKAKNSEAVPLDTEPNTRKSSRLTTPNKNQDYNDLAATNSADSDTTNPIGNNNFSKATSKNYYDPLANEQNTPSPRPQTAPASRALFRNNKVIYTMKIRLPDTNDIMKSMKITLKEWFKVMKDLVPNLVVYV